MIPKIYIYLDRNFFFFCTFFYFWAIPFLMFILGNKRIAFGALTKIRFEKFRKFVHSERVSITFAWIWMDGKCGCGVRGVSGNAHFRQDSARLTVFENDTADNYGHDPNAFWIAKNKIFSRGWVGRCGMFIVKIQNTLQNSPYGSVLHWW